MKKISLILSCLLPLLAACSTDGPDIAGLSGHPIYLRAGVDETPRTRSPYVPMDQQDNMLDYPTATHPLHTDVWGSTTPYVFTEELDPDNGNKPYDGSGENGKVAIHTDAIFQSGDPQLLRTAIYNETTKPEVFFVAFSPISSGTGAWSTTDGTKAMRSFYGNDDLLFAPQVKGTYAQDFSKSPLLHFRHLLTWLRIEVKAESEAVSNSWGKIRSISLTSGSRVEVNLAQDAYDSEGNYLFNEDNVKFDEEKQMSFYQVDEEEVFEGSDIKIRKVYTNDVYPVTEELIPYKGLKEVAYVMCAPVMATATTVEDGQDVASAEYTLRIVTEKRTVSIPVDLMLEYNQPYIGSTRCKQFTLLLNFKMGNTVYVATSVSDWRTGAIVTEDVDDDDIS